MSEAYHFTCHTCLYYYAGPVGHVHAKRDQVVSVICPSCRTIEARRLNWTQLLPEGHSISDHPEKLQVQPELKEHGLSHERLEGMVRAADNKMEWNDYSLYLEDVFTCWSCEKEVYIWDTPVCPCCGDRMKRDFNIDMDK